MANSEDLLAQVKADQRARLRASMVMVRFLAETAVQTNDRELGEVIFREAIEKARWLARKFGFHITPT